MNKLICIYLHLYLYVYIHIDVPISLSIVSIRSTDMHKKHYGIFFLSEKIAMMMAQNLVYINFNDSFIVTHALRISIILIG